MTEPETSRLPPEQAADRLSEALEAIDDGTFEPSQLYLPDVAKLRRYADALKEGRDLSKVEQRQVASPGDVSNAKQFSAVVSRWNRALTEWAGRTGRHLKISADWGGDDRDTYVEESRQPWPLERVSGYEREIHVGANVGPVLDIPELSVEVDSAVASIVARLTPDGGTPHQLASALGARERSLAPVAVSISPIVRVQTGLWGALTEPRSSTFGPWTARPESTDRVEAELAVLVALVSQLETLRLLSHHAAGGRIGLDGPAQVIEGWPDVRFVVTVPEPGVSIDLACLLEERYHQRLGVDHPVAFRWAGSVPDDGVARFVDRTDFAAVVSRAQRLSEPIASLLKDGAAVPVAVETSFQDGADTAEELADLVRTGELQGAVTWIRGVDSNPDRAAIRRVAEAVEGPLVWSGKEAEWGPLSGSLEPLARIGSRGWVVFDPVGAALREQIAAAGCELAAIERVGDSWRFTVRSLPGEVGPPSATSRAPTAVGSVTWVITTVAELDERVHRPLADRQVVVARIGPDGRTGRESAWAVEQVGGVLTLLTSGQTPAPIEAYHARHFADPDVDHIGTPHGSEPGSADGARPSHSVAAEARLQNRRSRSTSLSGLRELRRWVDEPDDAPLMVLFGEYGSGKTFLLRMLNEDLHSAGRPVLFVDLARELSSGDALQPREAIARLLGRWDRPGSDVDLVLRMVSEGELVAIFDGLDEPGISRPHGDVLRFIHELHDLASSRSRIVVSSRESLFESDDVAFAAVRGGGAGDRRHRNERDTAILQIRPLTWPQVTEAVRLRVGADEAPAVLQTIRTVYDLDDLARRPVTLVMIIESLHLLRPAIDRGQTIGVADLYRASVQLWLERDRGASRLGDADKLAIIRQFAVALWTQGASSTGGLRHRDLAPFLRRRLTQRGFGEDRTFTGLAELLSNAFLVRDGDNFRFAHRSFLEFFVAEALVDALAGSLAVEIGELDDPFLTTAPDDLAEMTLAAVLGGPKLSAEITRFVLEILAADPEKADSVRQVLALLVGADRDRQVVEATVRLVAAWSAPESPIGQPPSLAGARLERTFLPNERLRRLDLRRANLSNAYLAGTQFDGSRMTDTDLTGACLARASVRGCDLNGVRVDDATDVWALRTERARGVPDIPRPTELPGSAVLTADTGQPIGDPLTGHNNWVRSVAWNHDGTR
ncbi:MAG: hypothetical protein GY698_09970, partial [Actinomycetia bacterium]|nr:hypothetical protein [Actinomycetes bacterium]